MKNVLETTEAARAYVDSIVVDMDCPACGDGDWVFMPGCAGLRVVFAQDGDATISDQFNTSMNAIAYACGRCGFVRLHHFRDLMFD
jgi:predicted RNA-binding Zn-ribbon protein involved in translation (DUF1610 family)